MRRRQRFLRGDETAENRAVLQRHSVRLHRDVAEQKGQAQAYIHS